MLNNYVHGVSVVNENDTKKTTPTKGNVDFPDLTIEVFSNQNEHESCGSEINKDKEDSNNKSILFEEKVSFEISDGSEEEFKCVGMGILKIKCDDCQFGYHVSMISDYGYCFCDHVITIQTILRIDKEQVAWTAIDFSVDPPRRRRFRAFFCSIKALEEFNIVFKKGKEVAIHFEIDEKIDNLYFNSSVINQNETKKAPAKKNGKISELTNEASSSQTGYESSTSQTNEDGKYSNKYYGFVLHKSEKDIEELNKDYCCKENKANVDAIRFRSTTEQNDISSSTPSTSTTELDNFIESKQHLSGSVEQTSLIGSVPTKTISEFKFSKGNERNFKTAIQAGHSVITPITSTPTFNFSNTYDKKLSFGIPEQMTFSFSAPVSSKAPFNFGNTNGCTSYFSTNEKAVSSAYSASSSCISFGNTIGKPHFAATKHAFAATQHASSSSFTPATSISRFSFGTSSESKPCFGTIQNTGISSSTLVTSTPGFNFGSIDKKKQNIDTLEKISLSDCTSAASMREFNFGNKHGNIGTTEIPKFSVGQTTEQASVFVFTASTSTPSFNLGNQRRRTKVCYPEDKICIGTTKHVSVSGSMHATPTYAFTFDNNKSNQQISSSQKSDPSCSTINASTVVTFSKNKESKQQLATIEKTGLLGSTLLYQHQNLFLSKMKEECSNSVLLKKEDSILSCSTPVTLSTGFTFGSNNSSMQLIDIKQTGFFSSIPSTQVPVFSSVNAFDSKFCSTGQQGFSNSIPAKSNPTFSFGLTTESKLHITTTERKQFSCFNPVSLTSKISLVNITESAVCFDAKQAILSGSPPATPVTTFSSETVTDRNLFATNEQANFSCSTLAIASGLNLISGTESKSILPTTEPTGLIHTVPAISAVPSSISSTESNAFFATYLSCSLPTTTLSGLNIASTECKPNFTSTEQRGLSLSTPAITSGLSFVSSSERSLSFNKTFEGKPYCGTSEKCFPITSKPATSASGFSFANKPCFDTSVKVCPTISAPLTAAASFSFGNRTESKPYFGTSEKVFTTISTPVTAAESFSFGNRTESKPSFGTSEKVFPNISTPVTAAASFSFGNRTESKLSFGTSEKVFPTVATPVTAAASFGFGNRAESKPSFGTSETVFPTIATPASFSFSNMIESKPYFSISEKDCPTISTPATSATSFSFGDITASKQYFGTSEKVSPITSTPASFNFGNTTNIKTYFDTSEKVFPITSTCATSTSGFSFANTTKGKPFFGPFATVCSTISPAKFSFCNGAENKPYFGTYVKVDPTTLTPADFSFGNKTESTPYVYNSVKVCPTISKPSITAASFSFGKTTESNPYFGTSEKVFSKASTLATPASGVSFVNSTESKSYFGKTAKVSSTTSMPALSASGFSFAKTTENKPYLGTSEKIFPLSSTSAVSVPDLVSGSATEIDECPCEFCGELYPLTSLIEHETGCQPESTSYAFFKNSVSINKPNTSNSADTFPDSTSTKQFKEANSEFEIKNNDELADQAQAMISCPFCKQMCTEGHILEHTRSCPKKDLYSCALCDETMPDSVRGMHEAFYCKALLSAQPSSFDSTSYADASNNSLFGKRERDQNASVNCPKCHTRIIPHRMDKHLEMCQRNVKPCRFCGLEIHFKDETGHLHRCPSILAGSGSAIEKRKEKMENDSDKGAIPKYSKSYVSHQDTSENCPNCHTQIHPLSMDKHLEMCQRNMKPCRFCGKEIHIKDETNHLLMCSVVLKDSSEVKDISHPPAGFSGTDSQVMDLIPCEFCNEGFPMTEIVQHETGCYPELTSFTKKDTQVLESAKKEKSHSSQNNSSFFSSPKTCQISQKVDSRKINTESKTMPCKFPGTFDQPKNKTEVKTGQGQNLADILAELKQELEGFQNASSDKVQNKLKQALDCFQRQNFDKVKEKMLSKNCATQQIDGIKESGDKMYSTGMNIWDFEMEKHTSVKPNNPLWVCADQKEDVEDINNLSDDECGESLEEFWKRARDFLKGRRAKDLKV